MANGDLFEQNTAAVPFACRVNSLAIPACPLTVVERRRKGAELNNRLQRCVEFRTFRRCFCPERSRLAVASATAVVEVADPSSRCRRRRFGNLTLTEQGQRGRRQRQRQRQRVRRCCGAGTPPPLFSSANSNPCCDHSLVGALFCACVAGWCSCNQAVSSCCEACAQDGGAPALGLHCSLSTCVVTLLSL